mmetsp:Transcript_86236/g.258670  ORF Transcript_86236/g.258670 Transcript_86236/m.258670 type:complete len:293 (+) Transcript_86236:1186-2064(+)
MWRATQLTRPPTQTATLRVLKVASQSTTRRQLLFRALSGEAGHIPGHQGAGVETRCPHCFITFATPAELLHHATHHCFPDDVGEMLRRFPVGAEVLDAVTQEQLVVAGAASNKKKAHSSVSARDIRRGIVADTPISRLQLARRGIAALPNTPSAARGFSSGRRQPSYKTEPLIEIRRADVSEVARLIADGSARYIDCRSESELGAGVISGSVNIPFPHNGNTEVVEPAEFLLDVDSEGFRSDEPVFVGCRSGARSALAAEVLINAGFTDVRSVDGGILAWHARGLPLEPFAG